MSKFSRVLVPTPRSHFLLVRCPDCGNEQVVFSHASTSISCRVCGRRLAKPTGGKTALDAQVVRILDKM